MDLCARRPAVCRARAAGRSVLLLAQSRRRASRPSPGRPCWHPASRRLCRVRRALRQQTQTRPDHRGGVLEPWPTPLLRAGRPAQGAAGGRGGAAHRRHLRHRTQDQRPAGQRPAGGAAERNQAARRRPRKMDARRTRPAVTPRRDRPGDRLHADALAGLYPLSRRRPHLPQQQRRRTRIARHCLGSSGLAIRRLRRGRFMLPFSSCC
jgi:hypothetical protein